MADHSRRAGGLSPEYALLGFLDQAPAHGYELHHRLVEELGEIWRASLSQTYNILTRLEEQGFIAGDLEAQEKRPARRRFRLTPTGQERFDVWLTAVSAGSVHAVRVELMTRLHFLYARDPAAALAAVQAQTDALEAAIGRLQERRQTIRPQYLFNELGALLRIRQLEVLADWLRDCRTEIVRRSAAEAAAALP